MYEKIISTLSWLPHYYAREIKKKFREESVKPKHVYLCICDHYEPYWDKADTGIARKRIQRWVEEYPKIAEKQLDSDGNSLKHSFFYPEEEYREDDMTELARLCHAGFGDVEIHLHHDNDTSENLRRTLIDYKKRLHEKHGLLSCNNLTGEIEYGFIHGNWALCNSRPDGRWCGVNDEISILLETGCYADFTMPSAPSLTQTRKVNSIYYALDNPGKPKSHNWGLDAEAGKRGKGLLMVQGPLAPDWSRRKYGFIPRIENSGLLRNFPPSPDRVKLWIETGAFVKGKPESVFVKLYTHGAQEDVMTMLFEQGGFVSLAESFRNYADEHDVSLHWVTARKMVQTIIGIETGNVF